MTAKVLREKFINFFVQKKHREIPSASLIPENDPTTLFISAGMHPLVPYLLGEEHPLGKRLCSVQKCLRTIDIELVGDAYHHTFFEMMGNWSLGDYWKEEMIPWSYEFLTKELKIPPEKISVTCFAGDKDASKDIESAELWEKAGILKERIYFLGREDNWWGPAGKTGPCGPDSEMFYDIGKKPCGTDCRPGCSCGKYFEIWNDVFMQYNKQATGKGYEFKPLSQKNIDTGMGIDRTVSVLNGLFDNYRTELFWPIIERIQEISGKSYQEEDNKKAMRIIADHLRAAVFLISDGVVFSNTEQGYVLRRLVRRAIRFSRFLTIEKTFLPLVAESVVGIFSGSYPQLKKDEERIFNELKIEEEKFSKTITNGLKEFERLVKKNNGLSGSDAFFLYETYGFPFELTLEMAKERNLAFDEEEFRKAQDRHRKTSQKGAGQKFTGGLADHSETAKRYHTATHLLHAALRQVLGKEVHQVGSNITAERMRFDFTYDQKLNEQQLARIQEIVNEKIRENLSVEERIMSLAEAKGIGANAFFEQKYGEKVKVYFIGDYSREVCGGPHVSSTGEIKSFKIIKEESCGSGRRRIYALI